MIHYHGTPITPRAKLLELAGSCFCVSHAEPRDVEVCHEIGQSVMLDNGAYSLWTTGKSIEWAEFVEWARRWLTYPTTWAVMPDVIDGGEEENARLSAWLFNHDRDVWARCAPVWHMHESLDHLRYLCLGHQRVCIGSSGPYRVPGSPAWVRRMDETFNAICGSGAPPTWLHMLRAMNETITGDWPFASADSTNIARNHAGTLRRPAFLPAKRAGQLDARQAPGRWSRREHTGELPIEPPGGVTP